MEITLEKIELVKDRTGVSYKDAKAALEAADGSVVDAIINIEESMDYVNVGNAVEPASESAIKNAIKKTIAKGNMSRIIVRKGDNVLLNLPLTVGAVGAILAPLALIFGVVAAAGCNCKIEFVNDKGQITDINGKVKTQYRKARAAGQVYYDKGMEKFDKIKESEFYGDLKEQGSAMYYELKDKGQDVLGDLTSKSQEVLGDLTSKSQEVLEDLKEKTADGIDADKVKEGLDGLWKKGTEFFNKNNEDKDEYDDFFEESDLDVDNEDAAYDEEGSVVPEEAPVISVQEPVVPAEADAEPETKEEESPISAETKDELAKILEDVAQESGIEQL